MKKATALLSCFAAVFSFVVVRASLSDQSQSIKIELQVFCIPPIQTITKTTTVKTTPEGRGVIGGVMSGGDVTASFPDGVVLLNIYSDQKADDLTQIIKERIFFPCPEVVGILSASVHEFEFDPVEMFPHRFEAHEEIFHRGRSYGEYWLQIIPVTMSDSEMIISIQFSARQIPYPVSRFSSDPPDSLKSQIKDLQFKKDLLEQTLGVGLNHTLLVGVPSNEGAKRGTVYWIALSPRAGPPPRE